ncbi:hypothetical protein BX600DRAFT_451500 [Xylariales sp. PMI_506]|nr:hypothetical protein BX600DRAFT_451500 [Xylariales sp. PMI_506]
MFLVTPSPSLDAYTCACMKRHSELTPRPSQPCAHRSSLIRALKSGPLSQSASKMVATRRNKRENAIDAEESSFTSPDRAAKRPRGNTSRLEVGLTDAEDKEEGTGRGYQQWTEWLQQINREECIESKKALKEFSQGIGDTEKQLKTFLHQQQNMVTERERRWSSNLREVYSEAVHRLPIPCINSKSDTKASGTNDSSPFQATKNIITSSRNLIKQYKECDAQFKAHRLTLPTETWKKDEQDIKELLKYGRRYGQDLVEAQLALSAYQQPDMGKHSTDEYDKIAAEIYPQNHLATKERRWGNFASEQIQALSRLARSI